MWFEDRSGRIKHDGPQTLWRQLADDITAEIDSGAFSPGTKLPSELDLSEAYGVARVTVRRAMFELTKEGLITVVHGRGTFVSERPTKRGRRR